VQTVQNIHEVDVLLVEDNPNDAELTLRALKKHNLANRLFHVKDGAEAIDFLFSQGAYSDRRVENGWTVSRFFARSKQMIEQNRLP
jgi:two-component system response regulator